MADRQKLVLMARLLVSFVAGGIVGSAAYANYHLHALLLPAGVLFRRNLHVKNYSSQDWDEHMVDRQKFVLMTCLLVKFVLMTCLLVSFVASGATYKNVQELKELFGCPLDSQPVAPAGPSKG